MARHVNKHDGLVSLRRSSMPSVVAGSMAGGAWLVDTACRLNDTEFAVPSKRETR